MFNTIQLIIWLNISNRAFILWQMVDGFADCTKYSTLNINDLGHFISIFYCFR